MTANDILEEIDLHFKRTDAVLKDMEKFLPLKVEDFDNIEVVKSLDSFIFRFIKIQDKMGDKLFPLFLQLLEEHKPNMPLIDVLNELERLGFIESAEEWIEFRKLRNNLTHEYPGNEEEIIDSLNLALDAYGKIKSIYNSVVLEIKKRELK